MRALGLMVVVVCLVVSSGCASIVSKSQYPVTITSNPTGAMVSVRDASGAEIHRATTPTTVTLSAKAGFFSGAKYTLQFDKGGATSTQALAAHIDPWYWGNILFGGLIGFLIVDPATGAMWKLDSPVIGNVGASSALPTRQPFGTTVAARPGGMSQTRHYY